MRTRISVPNTVKLRIAAAVLTGKRGLEPSSPHPSRVEAQ